MAETMKLDTVVPEPSGAVVFGAGAEVIGPRRRRSRWAAALIFLGGWMTAMIATADSPHSSGSTEPSGSVRNSAIQRSGDSIASRFDEQFAALREAVRGKRVGMLTNPSGVGPDLRQTADLLWSDSETTITAFFAPEHGLRGDHQAGAQVQDYIDPHTGVPVFSIYGVRRAPTDEQLALIDVLVFDIQDVGVRFYTYVWTMTFAMEACAKNGKEFIVFDRPNPIGLDRVEGHPNPQDYGLIGRKWPEAPWGVATRHGLTAGELARLVNAEWMNPKVNLTVIAVPGLTRRTGWEQTGRLWVLPSPNMPTLDTARLYPGLCVFEGSNVSEGRGTTKPFELIGAPWVDGVALAAAMNARALPGVRFRAAWFTPTFSKHAGVLCGGVQVHITDPAALDPIRTGLALLQQIYQMYPAETQITDYAGRLMGDPALPEEIKTRPVEEIVAGWEADLNAFRAVREKHLIYGDQPRPSGLMVK
ncbi:MAG: DUF1343 domain-containing protein [Candidatus Sumerlaeia bacterium]